MVDATEIGKRLYTIRDLKHLSRERLAAKAKVSAMTIYAIERGRVPNVTSVTKLARALDVRAAWLLYGSSDHEPHLTE